MAVDMLTDAAGTPTWWVTCADCGACGPIASRSALARSQAKAEGWSRCYRGRGEQFRCPGCRAGGSGLRGAPAELIARALLYAAGEAAGGTDTECFTDDDRTRMVATARDLVNRACAYNGSGVPSQFGRHLSGGES